MIERFRFPRIIGRTALNTIQWVSVGTLYFSNVTDFVCFLMLWDSKGRVLYLDYQCNFVVNLLDPEVLNSGPLNPKP